MPKIVCGSIGCKYNSDDRTCNAPKIKLSDDYFYTKWQGRKHAWLCSMYEESEEYIAAKERLLNFMR